MKERFSLKTDMDLNGFKAWYKKTTGKAFRAGNLDPEEIAPLAVPGAGLLRRMAIAVMIAREKHLVALEARLLGKHRRVLVIYGSGHLVYESAILEDLLGKPRRQDSSW